MTDWEHSTASHRPPWPIKHTHTHTPNESKLKEFSKYQLTHQEAYSWTASGCSLRCFLQGPWALIPTCTHKHQLLYNSRKQLKHSPANTWCSCLLAVGNREEKNPGAMRLRSYKWCNLCWEHWRSHVNWYSSKQLTSTEALQTRLRVYFNFQKHSKRFLQGSSLGRTTTVIKRFIHGWRMRKQHRVGINNSLHDREIRWSHAPVVLIMWWGKQRQNETWHTVTACRYTQLNSEHYLISFPREKPHTRLLLGYL